MKLGSHLEQIHDNKIRVGKYRHVQFRGGDVMSWGGLMYGLRTPLILIRGKLNARRYTDEVLWPFVQQFRDQYGAGFVFMDDNGGEPVITFIREAAINHMNWPIGRLVHQT